MTDSLKDSTLQAIRSLTRKTVRRLKAIESMDRKIRAGEIPARLRSKIANTVLIMEEDNFEIDYGVDRSCDELKEYMDACDRAIEIKNALKKDYSQHQE